MNNANDAKNRLEILKDNLAVFREQSVLFQQKTRSTDELHRTKREVEEKIGGLEAKTQDADAAAETYDREFLDRKAEFPDPYLKGRMDTLQDRTFTFFTLAFLLLTIAIGVDTHIRYGDFKTTMKYVGYMLLVGLFIFGLIFKYA